MKIKLIALYFVLQSTLALAGSPDLAEFDRECAFNTQTFGPVKVRLYKELSENEWNVVVTVAPLPMTSQATAQTVAPDQHQSKVCPPAAAPFSFMITDAPPVGCNHSCCMSKALQVLPSGRTLDDPCFSRKLASLSQMVSGQAVLSINSLSVHFDECNNQAPTAELVLTKTVDNTTCDTGQQNQGQQRRYGEKGPRQQQQPGCNTMVLEEAVTGACSPVYGTL